MDYDLELRIMCYWVKVGQLFGADFLQYSPAVSYVIITNYIVFSKFTAVFLPPPPSLK